MANEVALQPKALTAATEPSATAPNPADTAPLGQPSEQRNEPASVADSSSALPPNEQAFDLGDHPEIVANYADVAKVTGWVTPRPGVDVLRETPRGLPFPPTPDPGTAGLRVGHYNVALGKDAVKRPRVIPGVNDHLNTYQISGADGTRRIPMTTLIKGAPAVTYAARIQSEENGRVTLALESHPRFFNQTEFRAHDAHLKIAVIPDQDINVRQAMMPGAPDASKPEHVPDGLPEIEVDIGNISLLRPKTTSNVPSTVLAEAVRGTLRSVFQLPIAYADVTDCRALATDERPGSISLWRSQDAAMLTFRAPADMVPSTLAVIHSDETASNPHRGGRDLPRYIPAGGRVSVGTSDPNSVVQAIMRAPTSHGSGKVDVIITIEGVPQGRSVQVVLPMRGMTSTESHAQLQATSGGRISSVEPRTVRDALVFDFEMPTDGSGATLTVELNPHKQDIPSETRSASGYPMYN